MSRPTVVFGDRWPISESIKMKDTTTEYFLASGRHGDIYTLLNSGGKNIKGPQCEQ